MIAILETIKNNNPIVYSILQEQQKHPWEISKDVSGKTVMNTSTLHQKNATFHQKTSKK